MAFLSLGSDYIKAGYTQVDNVFLLSYLPSADPLDVKIYLLGLAMSSDDTDNSLEKMSLSLHVDPERIIEGFRYWEEKGLVSMTKVSPLSIKYLSVKAPQKPIVKLNGEKYKVFADEVARLFPERILSPNEYNSYFELMHEYKMEVNAMLLIMQYCKELGGDRFSAPYILAVATDWAKQGLNTEKKVSAHVEELESNAEDVRQIFSALGIKRRADVTDRQLYLSWTKGKNFPLDGILVAAKSLKRKGGMERLDELISELSRAEAYSAIEVAKYVKEKESKYELAKEITKALGTYYGSTDAVVESYVQPWLNLGFSADGLKKLARYCFLNSVRNLDGLAQTVDRFYRNGIISADGIEAYIDRQRRIDEEVREVFDKCKKYGIVSSRDRESYRTWTEWGFDKAGILAVADACSGEAFPLSTLNRHLAYLRAKGIFDEKTIKEELTALAKSPEKKKGNDDYLKHEYTEEQLKNVIVNFDDWSD